MGDKKISSLRYPLITHGPIFLGVFALFASIHTYLRDIGEGEKNKHLSRATSLFGGLKSGIGLSIVGQMLFVDRRKIIEIYRYL